MSDTPTTARAIEPLRIGHICVHDTLTHTLRIVDPITLYYRDGEEIVVVLQSAQQDEQVPFYTNLSLLPSPSPRKD